MRKKWNFLRRISWGKSDRQTVLADPSLVLIKCVPRLVRWIERSSKQRNITNRNFKISTSPTAKSTLLWGTVSDKKVYITTTKHFMWFQNNMKILHRFHNCSFLRAANKTRDHLIWRRIRCISEFGEFAIRQNSRR